LSACGAIQNFIPGENITLSIVYGSEKKDWLDPLVQQYNDAHNKTADGKIICHLFFLRLSFYLQMRAAHGKCFQTWRSSRLRQAVEFKSFHTQPPRMAG
jgi:hypothetical protein